MTITLRAAGFILARLAVDVCNVSVELIYSNGTPADPVELLAWTVEGTAQWLAQHTVSKRAKLPEPIMREIYNAARHHLLEHEAFKQYDARLVVFTREVLAGLHDGQYGRVFKSLP